MQAVNLLPRDLSASERSRLNLPLLGSSMVPLIALGLVIHGYGTAHSQVGTAIAELSVLNAQVAEIAPAKVRTATEQQEATAATSELVSEREARLSAVEGALATSPPLDKFLDQIARVLPNNVWLTTMSMAPTTAAVPGNFSIGGYTYSDPAVAQLLARLQLVPALSEVTLSTATQTTVAKKTLIQFQISATPVAPTTTTPAVPVDPTAPATTTAGGTTAAP